MSGSGDALEAARQVKDPEHERVQGKAKAQAPLPKGWPKEEVTEMQPQVSPKEDTNLTTQPSPSPSPSP